MAFKIDILIIYADVDNRSTPRGSGWIKDFKKFLELMLRQVGDRKSNVLIKSEHDSITGANMKEVGVLIPVLSPAFVKSEECLHILDEFHETTKQGTSEASRIFKVLKKPLAIEMQPSCLKELIGFEFYAVNDAGLAEEYNNFFGPRAAREFWMKMIDLSYDLHEALQVLQNNKRSKNNVKTILSGKLIYLAETGQDLAIQRSIIKRELQRHGYQVLPQQPLPQHLPDLKKIIQKELQASHLSIHLIGSSYGRTPEGSDKSIVEIQNQIASEKGASSKSKEEFLRLIWISSQLKRASEKQLNFIESIKRDMEASEGTEILQTSLEDFKNIIREELFKAKMDKKVSGRGITEITSNGKAQIYILYDKTDEKDVKPIKKHLEKEGFTVLVPSFQGEALDLRQHHITNLRNFDAAIIYQGSVNDQWVRMKFLDLLKAPGYGRNKPIKGKAIISKKEKQINLKEFRKHNVMVIDGSGNPLNSLKIFLEEVNE